MSDHKAIERWTSPRMHRDIQLVRWGHFGTPVLVFPTAGGDSEEIERHKLVAHLWPLIEAGRIKVYSCDSVAGRVMANHEGDPAHRAWMFNQFQQAIAEEVVPAIHTDSGPVPAIVAGASIGAFNAVALLCRYPHLFRAAIGMSGTYDVEKFVGIANDDLYFSSPMRFVPGLEGAALDRLRQCQVILASGTGRWEDIGSSWAMAHVLGAKGVTNRVDDWGPDIDHDWPSWWRMLPTYLDQLT